MNKPDATYWAIKHLKHDWYFDAGLTRKEAIAAFRLGMDRSWKHWYRQGYRAVKVKITPVEAE